MSFEDKYTVKLLCKKGFEITSRPADTIKESKVIGKYLLSDNYAHNSETTHENLDTEKVEVYNNATGVCVWDRYL